MISAFHLSPKHGLAAALVGVCLLALSSPSVARADKPNIESVLSAVVGVRAIVPADARTARFLGTERAGSGVVIDSDGLVLTIGYLILEASSAAVIDAKGNHVPARILAYDYDTGFGLLRAETKLGVKPIGLGESRKLGERDRVLVVGRGGAQPAHAAMVISRRVFSGYWEYLLEGAVFTAPLFDHYGGAALVDRTGKLVGIGSLAVPNAAGPGRRLPGNMFVPIDLLKPILADLLTAGRSSAPTKPWLGVFTHEAEGRLFVVRVAEGGPAASAGITPGDVILSVAGKPVRGQIDFYRKVWALGTAGAEVPLTVLKGAEVSQVTVRSADRYDYLKLEPSH